MVGEQSYSADAACAMLNFSLASSSLLLINKLCLHYFPVPAFVSTLQFFTSSVTAIVSLSDSRPAAKSSPQNDASRFVFTGCTAQALMGAGVVKRDRFEWHKVKPYLVYVGMFVATIYTNMRALQHSNVETIIVFRAVR